MNSLKFKFFGFLFFLLLGWLVNGYGQVLRNTRVVNSCVTEYTFGNATEDQFVIVVVTCNTTPTGTAWQPPLGLTELTEMLIVAGGGAGGKRDEEGQRGAGGGGAGGVIHVTNPSLMVFDIDDVDNPTLSPPLNIFIGAGGIGNISSSQRGTNGENSTVTTTNTLFDDRIAIGGGAGGTSNTPSGTASTGSNQAQQPYTDQRRGNLGGSGGGSVGPWRQGGGNPPILGGQGTPGQGNNGGNGVGNNQVNGGGGGGGADGQAVVINGNNRGGEGGPGRGFPTLIPDGLPISVPRIFGGGGGGVAGNPGNNSNDEQAGPGGIGGGGGAVLSGDGINGLPNTGGGGGAGGQASNNNSFRGGNGGSGIVIFRFDFFNILPVEFVYQEARFLRQTRSAFITWATAKEWESSHFEIERAVKGLEFEKIGEVNSAGWSDAVIEYEFEDSQLPLSGGTILYRLKQVDLNGTYVYSDVMSVRASGIEFTSGVWRAYPNPTNGQQLRINLLDRSQYEEEKITFRLVHPSAQSQFMAVTSEEEMNAALAQMVGRIPKGVFVVEIQWGQKVEHIKVLKQ